MNTKYAIFALAALVAIGGIIYFGTGANQQASIANLTRNTSSEDYTSLSKAYKGNVASIVEKVNVSNPGTSEKKRVIELSDGTCLLVGPAGRVFAAFECP